MDSFINLGFASFSDPPRAWPSRQKSRLLPAATEVVSEKAPQATFSNELHAL
jgi:hypothetical protein